MEHLALIEPSLEHEKQALEYIREFQENNSQINGVGGLDRYLDNYQAWLEKLSQDRHQIPNKERVPAETYFLIRIEDNHIVGMINIRLVLNERLKECGGHIGYGIRPSERRKGYNKINLYLALLRCQELNINEVYLDCDIDNHGSYRTMEALGGIRLGEYNSKYHEGPYYKYKINVIDSISQYNSEYNQKILSKRRWYYII